MKRLLYVTLISAGILLMQNSNTSAQSNFDAKLKFKSDKNYSQEIKTRDYNEALKKHKKIAGSLLGLSLDFQLGYNTTSANVDETSNLQPVTTTSKGGFAFGALLNVNLLGLGFSTGLDFTKKNFGIEIPYYDTTTTIDSVSSDISNSYMNIPLNVSFGGMVSEDIGVSFSGGPYLGFLLNPPNELSGYKDFDFGLNGILTGRYFLNPFMAVILGMQGQYGGLNNLLSTSSVETLNTFNWGLFTGLSVGF
ncbi:MAG: hypothetical protein IPL53_18175 [Ignavibacteria bacterium]|nr:hypothetical protein [Ignavibacteria bacterium]